MNDHKVGKDTAVRQKFSARTVGIYFVSTRRRRSGEKIGCGYSVPAYGLARGVRSVPVKRDNPYGCQLAVRGVPHPLERVGTLQAGIRAGFLALFVIIIRMHSGHDARPSLAQG